MVIQSLTEGHLNCFQFGTSLNIYINICVKVLCRNKFSNNLSKYLGVKVINHKTLFNFVRKVPHYLSKWLYYFVFPLAVKEHYCCSNSCQQLVLLVLGIVAILTMISYCCLNLNSFTANDVEHPFTCFPIYMFLNWGNCLDLGIIFLLLIFLFLGFYISLYFLNISPVSYFFSSLWLVFWFC